MSDNDALGADDLQAALAEMPMGRRAQDDPLGLPLGDSFCLDKHLEAIQRHYIQRALREAGGVKSRAARLLGLKNYQTLDAQLKRLGVV
jgi:transcriptional regulator with GAF, ATPase, and Fis domain